MVVSEIKGELAQNKDLLRVLKFDTSGDFRFCRAGEEGPVAVAIPPGTKLVVEEGSGHTSTATFIDAGTDSRGISFDDDPGLLFPLDKLPRFTVFQVIGLPHGALNRS